MSAPLTRRRAARLLGVLPLSAAMPGRVAARDEPELSRPDLTDPVLCESVRGFREYDERDKPTYREDEKIQVYLEPFNYLIARDGPDGGFRAHLSLDATIRKAGSDRVFRRSKGLVDYEPKTVHPPMPLYLTASIALENVPPGDYELLLTLSDLITTEETPAERTIAFKVAGSR